MGWIDGMEISVYAVHIMHLCYEHHHSAVLIIFNGDEGIPIWWIHLLNSNK